MKLLGMNSLSLSLYGSTALVDLDRFFSFLIHAQSVVLLGQMISPSQGRYVYIEQHKYGIYAHRHPCFGWDSKPRSQCSSGAKTIHVLGRAVTLIDVNSLHCPATNLKTLMKHL
jgi:hypothetical protein